MNKGTHYIGQPMYGLLISLLEKSKILKISHIILKYEKYYFFLKNFSVRRKRVLKTLNLRRNSVTVNITTSFLK